MGKSGDLTASEPYEPDMDPEDAAEVLAQTTGSMRVAGRRDAAARLESPESAARIARRDARLRESYEEYVDRMLEVAAKWDKGVKPTDDEMEWVAGRAAMEILMDPTSKTVFRLKAIDQGIRIREKHLLTQPVPPPGAAKPAAPPAVTLPGAPRLVTG